MIAVILVFAFYKNIDLAFNPHIAPRKVTKIPIEGTWAVDKYVFIGNSQLSEEEAKKKIGKKAIFNPEEVYFNNSICRNPSFKVKVVESDDYFWNNFKIKPDLLGIKEAKVKVVTVSSNNNFFYDYIQINDNLILQGSDGMMLFFTKEGSQLNNSGLNHVDEKNSRVIISKAQKEIISKSGLLLGLKYKNDSTEGCSYRTIWIRSAYGKVSPILETKDIILPRKSGFWKIGVEKKSEQGINRDVLWGIPVDNSPTNSISKVKVRDIPKTSNEILFVGNEYISLDNEEMYIQNGEKRVKKNYFSVIPIDNINGSKVDFSKAFSEDAGDMLKKSADMYLKKLNSNMNDVDRKELETNWSVSRRSGRWILRGRLPYGDFDIIYATPKILTTYDDLYPSFNIIKDKVPEVVDVYTSPNKDFIVVLTQIKLKVFLLNNGTIGDLKMEIDLNENENVIMSQWATGSYVDEWGKIFTK